MQGALSRCQEAFCGASAALAGVVHWHWQHVGRAVSVSTACWEQQEAMPTGGGGRGAFWACGAGSSKQGEGGHSYICVRQQSPGPARVASCQNPAADVNGGGPPRSARGRQAAGCPRAGTARRPGEVGAVASGWLQQSGEGAAQTGPASKRFGTATSTVGRRQTNPKYVPAGQEAKAGPGTGAATAAAVAATKRTRHAQQRRGPAPRHVGRSAAATAGGRDAATALATRARAAASTPGARHP